MKSLHYTVYRSGSAGLSNLVMSVEVGVVLSALLDRVLVLKGNNTPVANIVHYDRVVRNTHPSKVTDLMELGVPWVDEHSINLAASVPHELCTEPSWNCLFYFPAHLATDTDDFRSFARGRTSLITVGPELEHIPTLSFSGGPEQQTLCFYSYFFYLDAAARKTAFDALRNIRPKLELAHLAKRVASELGPFNAAHIRRGDFKVTTGVTIRDRTPDEAIQALDQQFSRRERLVILTDEAEDPFFDAIKTAFPDHVFLDHHVLEQYGADFGDLPARDSIALAFLSQLIAAESQDFIGSMTSTFTSLIQRMRGNAGKNEPFKFFWNELPAPGDTLLPGRHSKSDCIRLANGVMVEDRQGPYTWNRIDQRLNPAWMREWPESFLVEDRLQNRAVSTGPAEASDHSRTIGFLGATITASSNRESIARNMCRMFDQMTVPDKGAALAEVRIDDTGSDARLLVDGEEVAIDDIASKLLRAFYRETVKQFLDQYTELIWLHASCASSHGSAVVLPGAWGHGKSSIVQELCKRGWMYASDDITPLDATDGVVLPFPGTPQVRAPSDEDIPREKLGSLRKSAVPLDPLRVAREPQPLLAIVFPQYARGAICRLTRVSPASAAGRVLENCISFTKNDDPTIQRMCALLEHIPAFELQFASAPEAAELLVERLDPRDGSAGEGNSRQLGQEVQMGTGDGVREVEVDVTLAGGMRHSAVLPSDSAILHDLFAGLVVGGGNSQSPPVLVQLPQDGGRTACSFMSSALVSVTTTPPVLIELGSPSQTVAGTAAPNVVLIDDFLTPEENRKLLEYALEHEPDFKTSGVTTDVEDYRKSQVLHSVTHSRWYELFMSRLTHHLPHIAASLLNSPDYTPGRDEFQLTASNDGDYFKAHADRGNPGDPTQGREITFVYYLHRTPRPFSGGDLLFYHGDPRQTSDDNRNPVTTISPRNNRLVAFTSDRWHEVDLVRCPSGAFADSRFTVNGWLRRDA